MENISRRLAEYPLFMGLGPKSIEEMLKCCVGFVRHYSKDGVVLLQGDKNSFIYVVVEGSVRAAHTDISGNESRISFFSKGEIFGEILSGSDSPSPVTVTAAEKCTVLFLPFDGLISCSTKGGIRVVKNLFAEIAEKYFEQRRHLEVLSQRNIRDRLLLCLSQRSRNRKKITLPFSRQALADYLACDRSALSRELSKLKEEGIIDYKGNKFIIKNI